MRLTFSSGIRSYTRHACVLSEKNAGAVHVYNMIYMLHMTTFVLRHASACV